LVCVAFVLLGLNPLLHPSSVFLFAIPCIRISVKSLHWHRIMLQFSEYTRQVILFVIAPILNSYSIQCWINYAVKENTTFKALLLKRYSTSWITWWNLINVDGRMYMLIAASKSRTHASINEQSHLIADSFPTWDAVQLVWKNETFTSEKMSLYMTYVVYSYLRQGGYVFAGFRLFVCLFVCLLAR